MHNNLFQLNCIHEAPTVQDDSDGHLFEITSPVVDFFSQI